MGPDRISTMVYQMLESISSLLLLRIVNKLEDTRISPPNFNNANFYTPSKVEGTTNIAEIQPISVFNTNNRIIAKVTVITLTPILQQFLQPKQHTFFQGQSIENVLQNLNKFFYSACSSNIQLYALLLDFKRTYDNLYCPLILALLKHIKAFQQLINFVQVLF
jgi:hypothetical protein